MNNYAYPLAKIPINLQKNFSRLSLEEQALRNGGKEMAKPV
jgi:hypothetical protein